jgi:subtilisin family serine protease
MDPALWEQLRLVADRHHGEVEALVRLDDPRSDVPGLRVISRFGPVATCRLRADSVLAARADRNVLSLKAPRPLGPETSMSMSSASDALPAALECRRPPDVALTGSNVCVGIVDWGCDFDHPNFKRRDGSTRLLALWDQRESPGAHSPSPYGYGIVHGSAEIDAALFSNRPYETLGYHPADSDRDGSGAHGTLVMDIAAGNGQAGGPLGIAPEADLIFVHLADRGTGGLANLGDSARILEAVDFIATHAGRRPWVINLSIGRHGGPHDGTTLCELALDFLLAAGPGRSICQSAGNYFDKACHASGQLKNGAIRVLTFVTNDADVTPNELEVWYSGGDRFRVQVESPTGMQSAPVYLDEQAELVESETVVGRLYHRAGDPNNRDNHIDLFLDPWAPAGSWLVTLQALEARNGIFHAWLERDEACADCQAHFARDDADVSSTIGTLASTHLPIVVGAYASGSPGRELASFSSSGPCRDGRRKPDLVAPGVEILGAQSAPRNGRRSLGALTRKSGTSFASPHVAGAVALCLQRSPYLTSSDIRTLVLDNVERVRTNEASAARFGRGYLDISKLATAVGLRDRGATVGGIQSPRAAKRRHQDSREPRMQLNPAHLIPLTLDPDRLYWELSHCPNGLLSASIEEAFLVVARPGEPPRVSPQAGDILLRVALGEPKLGHVAVLSDGALVPQRALEAVPGGCERGGPGLYATVIEAGAVTHTNADRFARRLLDETGRMPNGQLLLRPRWSPAHAESDDASNARQSIRSTHDRSDRETEASRLDDLAVQDEIAESDMEVAEATTAFPITAAQLQAAAQSGLDLRRSGRRTLMESITPRLGIPASGHPPGQWNLYVQGDVRLFWLLRRLARPSSSRAAATNLNRAAALVPEVPPTLVLTTASREHHTSPFATGVRLVHTWNEGGLDFLWQNRKRLGLPTSVTKQWQEAPSFVSPETGNVVYPGLIPERDEFLAYAAQTRMSFAGFEGFVRRVLGDAQGDAALAGLSQEARLVWRAYAFLAPGGVVFDSRVPSQHGQRFGVRTAFGYLLHTATRSGGKVDLNQILTDKSLHRTEWVRQAKTRVAEAAFTDDLLRRTSVPPTGGGTTGAPTP